MKDPDALADEHPDVLDGDAPPEFTKPHDFEEAFAEPSERHEEVPITIAELSDAIGGNPWLNFRVP